MKQQRGNERRAIPVLLAPARPSIGQVAVVHGRTPWWRWRGRGSEACRDGWRWRIVGVRADWGRAGAAARWPGCGGAGNVGDDATPGIARRAALPVAELGRARRTAAAPVRRRRCGRGQGRRGLGVGRNSGSLGAAIRRRRRRRGRDSREKRMGKGLGSGRFPSGLREEVSGSGSSNAREPMAVDTKSDGHETVATWLNG